MATVSGFVFNVAGGTLPSPFAASLGRRGQASIPLELMPVGAGLRLGGAREAPALAAYMVAVPACAFGLARAAALDTMQTQRVVLFAALPSASSSYSLAVRTGGNGELVAFIVSLATTLAVATLPGWLSVLG